MGVAMIEVTLPWPSADLSPNARVHYMAKARAVKAARHDAGWAVRRCFRTKPAWERASVDLTFRPPDERRRDLQNCIGSAKALVDGIADALGIDDSLFDCRYSMGEPVKGGAVLVTVRSA
jgi:crossover junction endodeoxyribonuclease RusA